MFLFIFESIGTSELLLIGVVALIFVGPRRLPEMVRKMGKMMAEFRSTTNQFKETWQREVDFEEEKSAFRLDDLEEKPVARITSTPAAEEIAGIASPEIREIDPAGFQLTPSAAEPAAKRKRKPKSTTAAAEIPEAAVDEADDKRNWL